MENGFVKTELKNNVAYVTFFHPQSNSLPSAILLELAKQIKLAGENKEAKVIVIQSGGDKAFCAGASFDELAAINDINTGLNFFSGFAHVINAMRLAPKFVIARVHNKAVGGGVGIASAADYTFATKIASVKLSELAVGIGPFVVGPAVQRKVGTSAFSQLTINATEWQTAAWAREKGMYAEVFETIEEMDLAIEKLSTKLCNSNPEAMSILKAVMWEGYEHWNELLIKRAGDSGKLVLSTFTKNAIDHFKSK
jgi:methylglutaconyl-CoA hydratase